MDTTNTSEEKNRETKRKLVKPLVTLVIILSAYFAIRIFSEIKKDSMLGESMTPTTISFSGHGEVQATPDIANVSFTIDKKDKTAKSAQDAVAIVEKSSLDFLKTSNIGLKDIKTENVSVNPTYEYQNSVCPQPQVFLQVTPATPANAVYCQPGKSVLTGYEASESISVKIRNTDDAGTILQGLGTLGITNLSGPNFAIDKEDDVKAQARTLAINDAKAKAKELAKELGVSLGKISSFNESGNSPIMYADKAMATSAVAPVAAPAQLPTGQSTITSDVTITYEIK